LSVGIDYEYIELVRIGTFIIDYELSSMCSFNPTIIIALGHSYGVCVPIP
jgi:hypothetical protein